MTATERRRPSLSDGLIAVIVIAAITLADWQWKAIFADWTFAVSVLVASVLTTVVAVVDTEVDVGIADQGVGQEGPGPW